MEWERLLRKTILFGRIQNYLLRGSPGPVIIIGVRSPQDGVKIHKTQVTDPELRQPE